MAVPKAAPAVSSQQKKISSFFASKPAQAKVKQLPLPSVLTDEPLDTSLSNPKKRSVITREDFEDSADALPPSKRQKTPTPVSIPSPLRNLDTTSTPSLTRQSSAHFPPQAQPRAAKISERTSKYLFSSTPIVAIQEDDEEHVIRQKQKLHERFVEKLGRPDSMAELKRRNRFIEDPTGGDPNVNEEDDASPDEEAQSATTKGNGRRGASSKSAHKQLTPMEKQVLEIKAKHMDTLLVVEVGYKFRFFGEDARTAAKVLSIVCIPGKFRFDQHPSEAHLDRFASASIPVHRLPVHVKRLVSAGHKVGVVRQLETAALKAAGDNRNAPFVRKLTNVYTKGTYIDDVEELEGPTAAPSGGAPATGHLLCLTETNSKGWGTDEKVHIGIIAVQPATGDIIYDDFEDGFMRSEIETRLLHIAPCEILVVGDISKATEKLVEYLSGAKANVFGDRARLERIEKPKTMAAQSFAHIAKFYSDKLCGASEAGASDGRSSVLDKVHRLSEHVTICLSAMITHLQEYGLEHVFDLTRNFQAFSARSHMLLNGNTLNSLEIFRNQTDNTANGSLCWALDQTQTKFGQRLLRKWVGRPLLDQPRLQERIDAVEELKEGDHMLGAEKIRNLLSKTKLDLERSLIRVYYKKCTRPELLTFLQSLQRIAQEYAHVQSSADAGYRSSYLNEAIAILPKILDEAVVILDKINAEAARQDDKYDFFREEYETEKIAKHKSVIVAIEHELDTFRKTAAEKLRKLKVDYVTVAGVDFLIEVENTDVKNVPASWAKISGTKKVSRFHAPEVLKYLRTRDQNKEALAAACDEAFIDLLTSISSNYQAFRNAIQSLATLDCLLSFADVANRPGYCKPTFKSSTGISVTAGRHPMVEQLLLDAYVPNDIDLSTEGTRALLITGPNMGGKSSYVRQVALIAIMAQIGSYVPAESAELGMLDAVFTRMGAFDNMMAGESTFMVELSETSDILKQATPRSLIILDELGRGTSTHDGVAIAHAVLEHIVRETGSLLLFITHYQNLAAVANGFDGELKNMHMKFTEAQGEGEEAGRDITFLYELGEGVAHRSYGLNVARLANVPKSVIETAAVQSAEMEECVTAAQFLHVAKGVVGLCGGEESRALEGVVSGIEQL